MRKIFGVPCRYRPGIELGTREYKAVALPLSYPHTPTKSTLSFNWFAFKGRNLELKTSFFNPVRQVLNGYTEFWKPIRFLQFSYTCLNFLLSLTQASWAVTAVDSLDYIDLFASYFFRKIFWFWKKFCQKLKVYHKLFSELYGQINLL